jgi:hypothetical protein
MTYPNLKKCLICKKEICNHSPVVTVLSGSMDASDGEVNVRKLLGTFMFHKDCFQEIAGEDFIPTNFENDR